ncbi:MAG TPA: L-rhamnose mutarotase [Chitinophagaceae bacterium]
MSKRYCLTLNLKNDPDLIRQYEEKHRAVWPEVLQSIRNSGILDMEIYRFGTRLFMIMEAEEDFTFERKQAQDAGNAKVAEWEDLMWKYQQPLEGAAPGEKWMLMEKLFDLKYANK